MKKKLFLAIVDLIVFIIVISACSSGYQKYQADYTGNFDIDTTITAFARSKVEFDNAVLVVGELIENDGKLFDIYNNYDGLNNIKTINDNAGISPVPVDDAIIDLLEFSIEAYNITGGLVNVAFGSVLRVWHDYRTLGNEDKDNAQLPPYETLLELSTNTDINNLIINRELGTVFLAKTGMSLDVGSIAKGFTAQRAIEVAKSEGLESVLINMGGNVVSYGKPMDGRNYWTIGIQDPRAVEGNRGIMDTVYVNDISIVSSGDYQRYYIVDGKRYSHIINPQTLEPPSNYSHVTVIHPHSGMADVLSTAMFIMSKEDGQALLREHGAEGLWIDIDGSIEATSGYIEISKNYKEGLFIDR